MEIEKEECNHNWTISVITTQANPDNGYIYQEVVYLICSICGEVKKQWINPSPK